MQVGSLTVTLNEDGSAQEGCTTQRPDEGAQHERELQGPELGQEGGWPAPAEAVGDQANEVGAPSITQQVGQHNLEGLGGRTSCGDHHVLGGGGAGGRG